MTDEEQIKESLDHMGLGWDDPLRPRAVEFAKRTPEEQNLWLFVEVAKMKPSSVPPTLNAVYTSVVALVLGWLQTQGGSR